ncbi:hypothetical protein [Parasynechococcus sp.]|uniref:cadherin repeat domain-containing protein n=1 Tax=Parasynechococcus sp. TaxID=3101203 RepID=UPI003704CFBD
MPQFQLKSRVKGFKQLDGMTAQVFNEDGDLLDSVNLANSRNKFKFDFDKDEALQGQNSADLTIKLTDTNGDSINLEKRNGAEYDLDSDEQTFTASISDRKKRGRAKLRPTGSLENNDSDAPVFTSSATSSVVDDVAPGTIVYDAEATDASPLSFSLSGTDASSFSIDAQSGEVAINASPDLATKASYAFDVVATDAAGNSSTQAVALAVTALAPNTITLSAQQDVYSSTVGGQVIGAEFVENADRLTSSADIVNAPAGSLGAADDLTDTTSGDGDQLNLSSNAANNLENAIGTVNRVVGIESLDVTATNDNSVNADFGAFQGLESVSASGSFTQQVIHRNYLLSGARNFDFSGVSTGGVNFTNTNAGVNTNDAITLTGSDAADVLQANNGAAQLNGRGGIDNIVGSAVVGSTVTGGSGRDVVTLQAANSVDVVSLVTITATNNGDDITGFIGANTNANAADLLRFDASTFNTYTAGTQVTEANQATADASQASNLFIVDTAANIANVNTQTGEGTLALANDTGVIFYASNGNFANAVDIGTIDDFANFVATANVDIV